MFACRRNYCRLQAVCSASLRAMVLGAVSIKGIDDSHVGIDALWLCSLAVEGDEANRPTLIRHSSKIWYKKDFEFVHKTTTNLRTLRWYCGARRYLVPSQRVADVGGPLLYLWNQLPAFAGDPLALIKLSALRYRSTPRVNGHPPVMDCVGS